MSTVVFTCNELSVTKENMYVSLWHLQKIINSIKECKHSKCVQCFIG
jgi:hypothetical protein